MTPSDESVKPPGRPSLPVDHRYSPSPPVACSVLVYGAPTTPELGEGSDASKGS